MRIVARILIGVMLLGWVGASAKHQFEHYDMVNGLSHNTVLAIAQDKYGLMWFGTKNGLNRFDGHSFKTYFSDAFSENPNNGYINALACSADNRIWIGTNEGLYIYDCDADTFTPFNQPATDGTVIKSNVTVMASNGDNIYCNSFRQGLFCYNVKTKQFTHSKFGDYNTISSISFDKNNNLLVGVYGDGLYKMSRDMNTHSIYKTASGQNPFERQTPKGVVETEQGQLFVATETSGVKLVNAAGEVSNLITTGSEKANIVHSMVRNDNELWIATEDGLYTYELLTQTLEHYVYEQSNPYSLSDNPLQVVYADKDKGVWIGSYFGGVNYSPYRTQIFERIFPRFDVSNSIHGRRIKDIVEDDTHQIWIGTEDCGLNCYDPTTKTFTYISSSTEYENIHGLAVDGDKLWVGTFSFGLKVIDIRTKNVIKSFTADGREGSLRDNSIFSLCRTRNGKIYVGTFGGLCEYQEDGTFIYIDKVPSDIVNDLCEDNQGNLWVGYYGSGLYMRQASTGKWISFTTENSKLKSENIISVHVNKTGQVTISTENGGLYIYDGKNFNQVEYFSHYTNMLIYSVVEDNSGNLWVSSNKGLLCYNPTKQTVNTFSSTKRIVGSDFNYNSALLGSDGQIYLGSLSGLVVFNPESLQAPAKDPRLVATELLINNVAVDCHSEDSPLTQNIAITKKLVLKHNQNSIILRLASLAYDENQSLEYKLQGFDKKWQLLDDDYTVRYTYLPAGSYKLLVRIPSIKDGETAPIYELDIVVKNPFYLTWWAWMLYILFGIGLAYFVWRYLTERSRMGRQLQMEKFEHEKEQELYQSKISFFTNVAHEIRTPLTLIKAPLENILKKTSHDKGTKEDLDIMDQNVNRLLDLTNQLLDFRKAEKDGMKINVKRCNINSILQSVYVRFTSLMREKGITSTITMPESAVMADVDKESLTKVISNLINNAVKYCEKTIDVVLSTDNEHFFITISNDGTLIEKSMREKIFEPFERGSNTTSAQVGTGVGLALARTLTELHSGELMLVEDDSLNVFKLIIPIIQSKPEAEETIEEITENIDKTDENQSKNDAETDGPTILIVEDNAQMLQYEKQKLQPHYKILTASNGEEALDILENNDVDLIVSDVMMEPMDGFELCKRVKENVNISHTPFILLTALTLDSAKVEGMEAGADSYIEKPFSMDYLLSTIKNLLRTRQNAKNAYAQSPFIPYNTVTTNKADEEFMERLAKVMEENLKDSDFDISKMAELMFMSRTGLNRKMRGIFNLTPNNYIKVERLKKAAYLMKTQNLRVNEVCYMVGFTSPSYFTQCFFKQFGLLPKEFINSDNSDKTVE